MQNTSQAKEIVVKLKTFTMLGYILIAFAVVYSAATYLTVQARGGNPVESLVGGVITLIVAAMFLYFGTKKRVFAFYSDYFEYRTNKVEFKQNYSDLMILKSYVEKGKSSINILFVDYEGEEQKLSSAHYGEDNLKEIFKIVYEASKSNTDFVLEDELGILSNGN